MRKPGWYWVKHDGEWMVAYYGVMAWTWMYMDVDGFDEMKLHEDKDVPFSEIGPRIPTPDEPWQCVPVEPTEPMLQTLHDKVLISCSPAKKTASILNDTKLWGHVLAAAPKPETQP